LAPKGDHRKHYADLIDVIFDGARLMRQGVNNRHSLTLSAARFQTLRI
jgi:hypothetical protein